MKQKLAIVGILFALILAALYAYSTLMQTAPSVSQTQETDSDREQRIKQIEELQKQMLIEESEVNLERGVEGQGSAEPDMVRSSPAVVRDDGRTTESGSDGEEMTSYVSEQFGFSFEYPKTYGDITVVSGPGKLFSDEGELVAAPNEDRYMSFNFTAGGKSFFSIEGNDFTTFKDGISVSKVLKECMSGKNPDTGDRSSRCEKRTNSNGVQYYFIDEFEFYVGELHLTLIPISDTLTLIAIETRTDSSELPSTKAEVEEYFKMIDSFKVSFMVN